MCCKDCKKRDIGCHSNCKDYADYRARLEQAHKARANERFFIEIEVRRNARMAKAWARRAKAWRG